MLTPTPTENLMNAKAAPPDTLATLGSLIDDTARRDAVHIAVLPIVAAHTLRPGEDVGLIEDGTVAAVNAKPVGIVDPYLKTVVLRGQRFWLFLYPRQITSLRHAWTHPEIKDETETQASTLPGHRESKTYLESFALRYGVSYEELMEHASEFAETGEHWCEGDRFEGECVDDEFWIHYARVTGRTPTYDGNFFSCSC